MKKKEASARIKINHLLEEAGWRFFDDENGPANIQLEPNVKMSKADLTGLGENFDKVKNGFVDFLLLDDKGKPFIVLEAKRRGQEPNLYLGMILTSMITGTIGGRLLYVAFSWTLYRGNIQSIFNIRNGGMSFYGALFGGILGALLFGRIKKTSFWKVADFHITA